MGMISEIDEPVAKAEVVWRTAEEGGRKVGPPTAPVYAATAVFVHGDDHEVQPEWPASAPQLSILLERDAPDEATGLSLYKVDFLVRELALPYLSTGAVLYIMEGPRVVGSARVREVM